MHKLTLAFLSTCFAIQSGTAQITERARPESWNGLIPGVSFKDRFLPMQGKLLSADTWGGKNVLPRYVDNGIEDRINSYWGGNILRAKDGLYHLMVCGWKESSPKGHMEWPHSIVFNAVSTDLTGPFKIKDTIGPGHNPEAYQLKDGRYVLYVIDGRYVANDLNGPWTKSKFAFDPRGRAIIEGLSNLSFARREDGSFLMVCRGGGIWISRDGLDTYRQISDRRAYPSINGEFEDPVVWKDNVQYNMIVNDWLGRIAYYLRSKDGFSWITDPGEAYMPGIAFHADGKLEDWFKYERMKVFQDKHGRAIQANFAVVDTLKLQDRPKDSHSSKNIGIPLNPGLLLSTLTQRFPSRKSDVVRIMISAEPGFEPRNEIDIATLRFGASSEVNFGRGARVLKSSSLGKDLVLEFRAADMKLTRDEFAPKLIGKYKNGKPAFGYTRVPWVKYGDAILSPKPPVFEMEEKRITATVEVENFGLSGSKEQQVQLLAIKNGHAVLLAKEVLKGLNPYEVTQVRLVCEPGTNTSDVDNMFVRIVAKDGSFSELRCSGRQVENR